MRRGWLALIATPFVIVGLICWGMWIFTEVTDVGELATLLLAIGLLGWFGVGLASVEEGPIKFPDLRPGRGLGRAGRKELREHRRRIALERAIEEAERRAGRGQGGWS